MAGPRDATTLFQRSTEAMLRRPREHFAPGAIVAGRYRIVALLGRGGMGEVYRADDLRLDQQVALKFLPPGLQSHRQALELFLGEVRLGRQVSHPNVCRLYDLGDHEGHDFITMEYVDGEDLAALLGRIGKLPSAKAVQIARDIAAGLAAAHSLGIVHRDLKPSNVMIDGKGRARVTDFGLAVLETSAGSNGRMVGTPAYMAPEQFTGADATPRSDVYALGLILYEVLTGEALHRGESGEAIIRQRIRDASSGSVPALPDLDPEVDRLLRRCLDPDPAERPESALGVLRSLPGSDPLAEALAAGETPSPELVAAAAGREELSLPRAWSVLGLMIALTVGAAALQHPTRMHHLIEGIRSPEGLLDRGAEIAERFAGRGRDRYGSFLIDSRQMAWLSRNHPDARDWRPILNARPTPVRYVYRQSPAPMAAARGESRIAMNDPPLDVPGMARVVLDHRARLLELAVVPPAQAAMAQSEPRWSDFFALAELPAEALRPAAPALSPPVATDVRRAWTGVMPGTTLPIRVEAAARAGRPVWFTVVAPWSVSAAEPVNLFGLISKWVAWPLVPLFTAFLAFRNLRRARGDRRGALRFALVAFVFTLAGGILRGHHTLSDEEIGLIQRILGRSLLSGVTVALAYLGLEPHVRRHAPAALISWVRLANGRLRDALVGRDLLIGLTGGALCGVVFSLGQVVQPHLGFRAAMPPGAAASMLNDVSGLLAYTFTNVTSCLMDGMTLAVLLVVLRGLVRNTWIANALLWAAATVILLRNPGDELAIRIAVAGTIAAAALVVFSQAGVLGAAAMSFGAGFTVVMPLTLDPDAFYSGRAAMALLIPIAGAVCAFLVSLGGKRALGQA